MWWLWFVIIWLVVGFVVGCAVGAFLARRENHPSKQEHQRNEDYSVKKWYEHDETRAP